jgi:hypothetical protein
MGFVWTPETEARLRDLAAQALRVRAIAAEFGVTRNSIIGKARRLGVDLQFTRSKAPRKQPSRGTGISFRAKFVRPQKAALPDAPEPLNIPFENLRKNHCRYAVTDDAPYFFCGAPKTEGSSYCEHHHGVCHV